MADIQGFCEPRFGAISELLSTSLDTDTELGASVAITLNGAMVVDLWGGWCDVARTTPWQRDTITNVWSSTKTVTVLPALVLIDRGLLDLDKPVCAYWEEFGDKGKADITIRQILSHSSGVSGWEQPVQLADLFNWEKSTAMLAAQAPWWEPGTASGYHDHNFGHLIGEVIRRITGKSLGTFLADEITNPLHADFHIGLAHSEFHRVANVVPAPQFEVPQVLELGSVRDKTLNGPRWYPEDAWTDAWRQAEIGGANGHGNARSLARLQALVACGGEVGGIRCFSPQTSELVVQEQIQGRDRVLDIPLRWGLGYALKNESVGYIPDGRVCLWGGWGGSVSLADLDRRMSLSYVMNRMESNPTNFIQIIRAAYAALGIACD